MTNVLWQLANKRIHLFKKTFTVDIINKHGVKCGSMVQEGKCPVATHKLMGDIVEGIG